MIIKYCYIKESFFNDHNNFVNMLDTGNTSKQAKRTHLCLCIEENNNTFFVPLRNNLGDAVRKFGRIGHSVPTKNRKYAGLDYRYTLIITEEKYIEWQSERKIPRSQYKRIEKEYDTIKNEFKVYLSGYIRASRKKRVNKEPLYRVSSLQNFNEELGVE